METWTLLTRSQRRVSDIQGIVKICGSLVLLKRAFFKSWRSMFNGIDSLKRRQLLYLSISRLLMYNSIFEFISFMWLGFFFTCNVFTGTIKPSLAGEIFKFNVKYIEVSAYYKIFFFNHFFQILETACNTWRDVTIAWVFFHSVIFYSVKTHKEDIQCLMLDIEFIFGVRQEFWYYHEWKHPVSRVKKIHI